MPIWINIKLRRPRCYRTSAFPWNAAHGHYRLVRSARTTLLRCLNFLETPNAGRILVNGETLFDAADRAEATAKSAAGACISASCWNTVSTCSQ